MTQDEIHYAPMLSDRKQVAEDNWNIFGAKQQVDVHMELDRSVAKHRRTLVAWAEDDLPEGFAVFSGLPPKRRVRMRTTGMLERQRLNDEHVSPLFFPMRRPFFGWPPPPLLPSSVMTGAGP